MKLEDLLSFILPERVKYIKKPLDNPSEDLTIKNKLDMHRKHLGRIINDPASVERSRKSVLDKLRTMDAPSLDEYDAGGSRG